MIVEIVIYVDMKRKGTNDGTTIFFRPVHPIDGEKHAFVGHTDRFSVNSFHDYVFLHGTA